MATNRDLLKEAIADAKAVKETAIANAKAALEEAFTPYLKEKLASKIAEMDEAEEVELEESEVSEVEKEMEAVKESDDMTEEVSLDELLAELDAEDENQPMDETKDMEDESMYEAKEEEEEMSIEDMSEDDLKSFIEDVIKDMVASGELEAGHEGMEGEEGEEAGEEAGEEGEEEMGDEEEINIDELLAEMKDEEVKEAEVDEMAPSVAAGATVSGDNPAIQAIAKALDKSVDWVKMHLKDLKQAAANIGGAAMSSKGKAYEAELEEAYQTVEALKAELNEINLLNAKLLYTNKIFRNKSLTETQKVNVLTAFDKATTKKEVELVYNTLTESLKVSTTKAPIKESLGSASKVLGGATSKPIIENDAFSRMRELAFGNKK